MLDWNAENELQRGWNYERWVGAFMVLGILLRLLRFGLNHPLWRDEAYLAVNLLDRDFVGLTQPLDYQQVCPLLFLWAEKSLILILGFGEHSLRLLPTTASIASLFVLRQLSRRLLGEPASLYAVAILAISYTPIRHGGEVKPYATDLFVALGLSNIAVGWLKTPTRTANLWALAGVGPLAIALSNPSIFVATSVLLVVAWPVLAQRSVRVILPWAVASVSIGATFLFLQRWVNIPQSESVMGWMKVYWAGSFPPQSLLPLLVWLVRVHTSYAFAYPAGGDLGGSSLTTILVLIGIVAMIRRGSRIVLALILAPFALGLLAASLGRYPYGGSARTMQYLVPSIILLASLGLSVALARIQRPKWRDRVARLILIGMATTGLMMAAWDVSHPFKEASDQTSRDFARRFWTEQSRAADIVCARADLHLPLDPLTWQGDRAAIYRCYQAICRGSHAKASAPLVAAATGLRPLHLVVFGETPADAALVQRWIAQQTDRFRMQSRTEQVLNRGMRRGKASREERYVVYRLVPVDFGR